MTCQWEQFRSTTPLGTGQQRQIQFCSCKRCSTARAAYNVGRHIEGFRPAAHVAARYDVLAWRPALAEPEPEEQAEA